MRIAFVIRDLGLAGAQRQLTLLVEQLVKRSHIVLVAYWRDEAQSFSERLRAAGAHIARLDTGPVGALRLPRGLRRELQAFAPDVIHGYMPMGNLLSLLVARTLGGVPVVWGVRASRVDYSMYDWRYRAVYTAQRALSSWPDLVIANSDAGLAFTPRSRATAIVPNGVDVPTIGTPRTRESLMSTHRIPVGVQIFSLIGRIDPMKGVDVFLRALAIVGRHKTVAPWGVVVGAGDPSFRQELRRLAKREGVDRIVSWLPPTDNVGEIYAMTDVVVSASLGEGFSNVVGEALSLGLPVVATRVGAAAELLDDDFGVVVQPKSPEDLAAGMCRALELVSPRHGQARIERMARDFSPTALADRTERLLIDVVRSYRRHDPRGQGVI